MSKPRDRNSLSWMPRHVPISASIFKRGFYLKDGIIKYRHGFREFGKAFCSMYVLSFLAFDLSKMIELIIFWVFTGSLVFAFLKGPVDSSFDTKKKLIFCSDIGFDEKNCYISNLHKPMPVDSIKRIIIRERAKKFFRCTRVDFSGLFVLVESTFSNEYGNVFGINHFEFSKKRYLKDYLDGVLAILGKEIEIDYQSE